MGLLFLRCFDNIVVVGRKRPIPLGIYQKGRNHLDLGSFCPFAIVLVANVRSRHCRDAIMLPNLPVQALIVM